MLKNEIIRSNIIPMNQHISKQNNCNEYSLKQHLFDPTKSSPPNLFMLKLKKRMSVYSSFEKDDKCDNK